VVNEELLEARLAALEAAQAWSPRVVSKLEVLIRAGDDDDLFRINALRYADDNKVPETEAIDLFLHAANVGLFDMEWLLVCGACTNVFTSFRKLENLDPHFACDLCGFENEADLDDYIHVSFTVSPPIRHIRFHDPESLPVEELYWRYHFSRDARPLPHGMTVAQKLQEWTRFLDYIEAGESRTVALELPHSVLGLWDALGPRNAMFLVGPDREEASPPLDLELVDRTFTDRAGTEMAPGAFDIPQGRSFYVSASEEKDSAEPADERTMRFAFPAVAHLPAGPIELRIHNRGDERTSAWVVEYPPVPDQAAFVKFLPVLTAKKLLSNQTFRRLFRSETVPESESLQVRDLTYLFTDLKDSTLMYDLVGDVTAYDLVRRHFDALGDAVARNAGALTKTIGDAIMATFVTPADAVHAAIDMHAAVEEFNAAITADLLIKIGIHRGRSLAVSLNDRIDYFGQDVNIAARVQQLAAGGEIVVSEAVYRADGVAGLLEPFDTTEEDGIMKGVGEKIPVFRVAVQRS